MRLDDAEAGVGLGPGPGVPEPARRSSDSHPRLPQEVERPGSHPYLPEQPPQHRQQPFAPPQHARPQVSFLPLQTLACKA